MIMPSMKEKATPRKADGQRDARAVDDARARRGPAGRCRERRTGRLGRADEMESAGDDTPRICSGSPEQKKRSFCTSFRLSAWLRFSVAMSSVMSRP